MKSVLVVGSGVAGALLARRLLESKKDYQITMFEAGPDIGAVSHRKWLDHLMAGANPWKPFWEDPWKENERLPLRSSRLFVKGGTTNHWGGWSLRFKPEDFELKSRADVGADWPITYEELAPFYTQAEHLMGIEGDSNDDDPPRYGDQFPFPAAPFTLNDMPAIEALEKLGMSYSHMPMARSGDKCVTTGTCRYCPVDARYSAAFDLAQLKDEHGSRLEIRTETPVSKVLMDGKKRARGVRVLNRGTGAIESMEGDCVAVCSGTVESTKLLLASANADWRDGIGNDSGHLGRHLLGHPLLYAVGFRPGNSEKSVPELSFVTLACRHFDSPKYQKEGKMLVARVGDEGQAPLTREILANSSRSEINAKMESGVQLAFYASIEQFESPENKVGLGAGTGKFGLPGTKIDYVINETTKKAQQSHAARLIEILKAAGCNEDSVRCEVDGPTGAHVASTCRMSRSEADGVVDQDLRVHGTDNLYVCSNAVYPNATATNPTLTVGALAVRLAKHIDVA